MSLQKDYEELLIASGYTDEEIRNNDKKYRFVDKRIVITAILHDKEHSFMSIGNYLGFTAANVHALTNNKRRYDYLDEEIKRVVKNWNSL